MIPRRKFRKPPYQIPSMEFIRNVPWNNRKVVSTFSGGGGSSTGYSWAGFKVVYANEFIKHASDTYRLNHPDTHVDERDIKLVTAEEILAVTGLKKGELDILDGSPPCQGFSIANQNRLTGKEHIYTNGISQKNEDMFDEYIRLLGGLTPKVFIAENVKGLTMGKAKATLGSFEMDLFDNQDETILHKLMNCGYVVRYQVLNAVNYGVPQDRKRAFFIGVRSDLKITPSFPDKLSYQYSVRDALPNIESVLARQGGWKGWKDLDLDRASPTITAKMGHKNPWKVQVGYGMGYAENKPGNSFPRNQIKSIDEPIKTIQKMPGIAGGVPVHVVGDEGKRKFTIDELKALGGFPADFKMIGSYGNQWSIIGNSVCPPQMMRLSKHIYDTVFSVIKE